MLFPKWHFKARVEQDNCEYGTYRVRFFIEGRVVCVNYYSAKTDELAYELLIVDVENFLGLYYDDFLKGEGNHGRILGR